MVVGFCGLGQMGRAMCGSLVAAGFEVRAWNRTRGKAPSGAVEVASPREAAQDADVVISMLADDAAVEAVVPGDQGLLAGLRGGAVHCGMSTISVQLSQRLVDAHQAAKQHYVAAPVFGRPDAAEARRLWIVCGGEDAALAACQPLFDALGQGTLPLGTAPNASLAKLCGNFMLAGLVEMFGEATTLAEKAGLDPEKLASALAQILFANAPIPKSYLARIAAAQFLPPGFALSLGLKDVSLALKAGEELRVPLPLASLARDHLLAALARGRAGWDFAGFASVVRENAGLPPRK